MGWEQFFKKCKEISETISYTGSYILWHSHAQLWSKKFHFSRVSQYISWFFSLIFCMAKYCYRVEVKRKTVWSALWLIDDKAWVFWGWLNTCPAVYFLPQQVHRIAFGMAPTGLILKLVWGNILFSISQFICLAFVVID